MTSKKAYERASCGRPAIEDHRAWKKRQGLGLCHKKKIVENVDRTDVGKRLP